MLHSHIRNALLLTVLATSVASSQRSAPDWKPTEKDVSYGKHPRNKLDFFRAASAVPTPVLVYFHGGGFVAGDKKQVSRHKWAGQATASGISIVSANYRFVKGRNSEPFPGSLMDGVRAVQFVRLNAKKWNLDPNRIVG